MPATDAPPRSLLDDPERHPLHGAAHLAGWGRVVVLAPHADDESLGAGGLLATLADAGHEAWVALATDGTQSHPDSPTYPPARLAALRERECAEAVARLGHAGRVVPLRLPDGAVPLPGQPGFGAAADTLAAALARLAPDTLVVPWRRDPHPDHLAVWHLASAVRPAGVRWVEYPVWAWARGSTPPTDADATAWRLDIVPAQDRKRAAIAAHVSQTTRLIADSPAGFVLAPDMLRHFEHPWELFLDPRPDA